MSQLRDCYPEIDTMTVEQLKTALASELADIRMLSRCGEVYAHVTNHQVSKPNTDPAIVIAMADDCRTKEIEEAINEDREVQAFNG